MKTATFSLIALSFSLGAEACTSGLFGLGTCSDPPETNGADANGDKMTADRLSSLVSCFKDKFGDGPYEFDGLTIPDAGNQGNEMGVADASGNFFVGIGNLCGCSQQIDGNIFEILMGAADGSVTSARTGCAGDQCSAVTGADGTQLPSGVYASFYACPAADYGECGGAGVNQFETCDVDLS